jgi:hypothetical protein
MRIVFVYWGYENAGSMLDLVGYARVAKAMGHQVALYGPPGPKFGLDYSRELNETDALVFVTEWTTDLQYGDRLDWLRLLEKVPRRRRLVIDCDGAYNDHIMFGGDYNHRVEEASRHWTAVVDSLSDKIFQPTLRPRRANVRPFLFHIYDPTWERPLDFAAKDCAMTYLGHTKFRWRGMSRVLTALEPVRDRLGRITLVGDGWGAPVKWEQWLEVRDDFYVDRDYLKRLNVEAVPPVPYAEVLATMSQAVFNPVVYRPLFEHLQLVTCRTFETPAAGTIPLFVLEPEYVREIYGAPALELVLGGDRPHEKILDVMARPEHYAEIVLGIREKFRRLHSPETRMRELLGFIEE